MTEVRVPEVFVERIRARSDNVDSEVWLLCWDLADGWEEMGDVLTADKKREMNWSEKTARGKTHKWFIESLCGELNLSPSSMYDMKRVGVNILKRELRQENMNFNVCAELLRNCNSGEDQIIPVGEVKERITWFNDMTDQYGGKPPSIREIKKHFRRNGDKEEWRISWEAVYRNLEQMEKAKAPEQVHNFASHVRGMMDRAVGLSWFNANAPSSGGEQNT